MRLSKILKNILFGRTEPTDFCEEIDGNLGKLAVEEVLAVVQPTVDEENLQIKGFSSSVEAYPHPALMKDSNNKQSWQVTIIYHTRNGIILETDKKEEYCWILVNDDNGEIKAKVYARSR
jgi:hypothetical protein